MKVEYNQNLKVPEIVSVVGGGALAPAATGVVAGAPAHEFTVKSFLKENAGLYGLTPEQVDELVKVSDYTNPAGKPFVTAAGLLIKTRALLKCFENRQNVRRLRFRMGLFGGCSAR